MSIIEKMKDYRKEKLCVKKKDLIIAMRKLEKTFLAAQDLDIQSTKFSYHLIFVKKENLTDIIVSDHPLIALNSSVAPFVRTTLIKDVYNSLLEQYHSELVSMIKNEGIIISDDKFYADKSFDVLLTIKLD